MIVARRSWEAPCVGAKRGLVLGTLSVGGCCGAVWYLPGCVAGLGVSGGGGGNEPAGDAKEEWMGERNETLVVLCSFAIACFRSRSCVRAFCDCMSACYICFLPPVKYHKLSRNAWLFIICLDYFRNCSFLGF